MSAALGRLSAVLHARRTFLTVAAAALTSLVTAGCGLSSDTDIVARVDDAELDRELFRELVDARREQSGIPADSLSDSEAARIDGQTARGIAGQFVTLELVRNDLRQLGIDEPAVDGELRGAERFDAEYSAIGEAWVGAPSELIGDERLRDWYDQGPQTSGVFCVQHILVADLEAAGAVTDRLDAGEAFATVAAEESLDTQSGLQGGSLGCTPTRTFRQTYIPEFVDGSLGLDIGTPSGPVESQFGQHIIRVMPFDELTGDDLLVSRLVALSDWHDVETDPLIGVWEFPSVLPLGT